MLKRKNNEISINFLTKSGVSRHSVILLIDNSKFQSELLEFVKNFAVKNPETLSKKTPKKTFVAGFVV